MYVLSVGKQAVHTLIALQKQYLESLGKLTPAEEDKIWQVIVGQRAEVGLAQSSSIQEGKFIFNFSFSILKPEI